MSATLILLVLSAFGCGDDGGAMDASFDADTGLADAADGSADATADAAGVCGDGERGGAEECDDGNTTGGDGCSFECTLESCGDGMVQPSEDCDDGNVADGDGCDTDCTYSCTSDTECDTGSVCSASSCGGEHACTPPTPLADGMACDRDGDPTTADVCRLGSCAPASCGDSVPDVTAGEQCDDGNDIDGDGCDVDCTFSCVSAAGCSDSNPCNGAETCDTTTHVCGGGTPLLEGAECSTGRICSGGMCVLSCGDSVVNGSEDCDDGGESATCDTDCTFAFCGDRVTNMTAGEDCDVGGSTPSCDSDCTLACRGGRHVSDYTVGGVDRESPAAIAVDPTGGWVLAGTFDGSVSFGGATRTSAGESDMYVVAFDATGAYRWDRAFGGTDDESVGGVVVDTSGNVYVAGAFENLVDFGGGRRSSTSFGDLVVLALDPTGAYRWDRAYGETDNAPDIALDSTENLVVVGKSFAGVDFGGGSRAGFGSGDVFVLGLTSAGAYRWDRVFGGANLDAARHVALDAMNRIFVAGFFAATVDFGGGVRTSAGSLDVFVLGLDASADYRWDRHFGGTFGDTPNDLAMDGAGRPYLATDYARSTIRALASDGTDRWTYAFGTSSSAVRMEIVADASGNVWATGAFNSGIDFGGGRRSPQGRFDGFALSVQAGGSYGWDCVFGGAGDDFPTDVMLDGASNLTITGSYSGTPDFGGGGRPGRGLDDIFVMWWRR